MDSVTDSKELELIKVQEDFLERIAGDLHQSSAYNHFDMDQIKRTIEDIREDIKVGKTEDLPSLFYQMQQQFRLYDKFNKPMELPDPGSPYFAYMKVWQDKKEKKIFLGHFPFIPPSGDYRIVDWTNAPIAQVYYNYQEGESFEIDLPGKTSEGVLVEKNIITIRRGSLVRIDKNDVTFIKKDGGWYKMANTGVELGGGEGLAFRNIELGTGLTEFESPEVISLLDASQFRLLNLDEKISILLTGGAGSGKTTVAIHRICKLCFNKHVSPQDILVLVPHHGLVLLSRKILNSLGLDQIKVMTGREWFRTQGIRFLPGINKEVCQDTPFRVSLLKRHRNMMKVIHAYLGRKELEIVGRLKRAAFDDKKIAVFAHQQAFIKLIKEMMKAEMSIVQRMLLEQLVEELTDYNTIREEIFKDRNLLKNIMDEDSELITLNLIEETIRHTNKQFLDESRDEDSREHTLDQKHVGYQTPDDVSGTIDMEDYPIMLLLCHTLHGGMMGNGEMSKAYRHIVLDEAQEISPMEMKVFGQVLDQKRGSFTVAGDLAQKVDQTSGFTTWHEALVDLNLSQDLTEIKTLEIAYRSPQKIIDLAHYVLGPLAPMRIPISKKQHGGVLRTIGEHEAHILIMINERLEKLMEREPKASTAIICSSLDSAKRYHAGLSHLGNIRLVEDANFIFRPGVDITTLEQVKGLEFDYVIIPDLDLDNYPVSDYSRRKLHLAMTRAIYQLWILSPVAFSPLIPNE
ncbi:MAG: hypothetical protein A2381_19810 [Bdellovibrionales bacterium RIFOXYB1_FULL_37_110]|nr:MAG: hypothetical protein A2181_03445 [Bdellovibrionales bacterium RIFOXYA1_FULL_38_20]OFZ60197.1 MAG: hypothetical protein A2381_19810 [Bdellovibrionales bacterium RIFOXYB1_FULL_37_110]